MLDCIVIGGGISGISFAHFVRGTGKRVLVLEKENRMGGQICTKSAAVDDTFWVELGTHTCYNSYTHFLSVIAEAGLSDRLLAPAKQPYRLYTDWQMKGLMSGISLRSMLPGCLRLFFSSKKGKSVQAFFSPIVGKTNYERLFRYLFRAVICQDADTYPAEFFLKKRRGRAKEISRKFSYRNGFAALVNDLIARDGLTVKTNTCVAGVERNDDAFRVLTTDGQTLLARNVAFAIDPAGVARLVKSLSPEAAQILGDIPVSRSEALGVIVRKERINMPEAAIIIPTSGEFLSVVSRDVLNHPELRGFTFHFFADHKTRDEKQALACRVLGIRETDVLETVAVSHVLPSPRVRNADTINRIGSLRGNDHLFFLGNYFYGLSVEDCVHRSHEEFERFLNQ